MTIAVAGAAGRVAPAATAGGVTAAVAVAIAVTVAAAVVLRLGRLALALIKYIGAQPTIEAVIAIATLQRVVAVAADQHILAVAAVENIVPSAAGECILTITGQQRDRTGDAAIGLIDADLVIAVAAGDLDPGDGGRRIRVQKCKAADGAVDVHVQLRIVRRVQRNTDRVVRVSANNAQYSRFHRSRQK